MEWKTGEYGFYIHSRRLFFNMRVYVAQIFTGRKVYFNIKFPTKSP